MISYLCDLAVLPHGVEANVEITIANGRFSSVKTAAVKADGEHLAGITMPGLANAHSHVFHRALRSRTQADRGTFWTWRDLMYRAAARLTPDNYRRLATATFAEMALAGISVVGEFHYVHHQLNSIRYADPNEMGHALLDAAAAAGIRITLLDTLYLHGGLSAAGYSAPAGAQLRYTDGTADGWASRVSELRAGANHKVGAAIHSVRAVDPVAMEVAARWTAAHQAPLHAHVSEQQAENDQCRAHHGITPVALLAKVGALSDRFSAVHATHLSSADMALLANAKSCVCVCPTTERDLGDGIGETSALATAGVGLTLGSDSHAVIDHFEEGRAVELNQRLRLEERGIHHAAEILVMATSRGHESLGWPDAGRIEIGARADLTTIKLDSVRLAGSTKATAAEAAVFAAGAADVSHVVVDGRVIVAEGQHQTIDTARELTAAIADLLDNDD